VVGQRAAADAVMASKTSGLFRNKNGLALRQAVAPSSIGVTSRVGCHRVAI
jgi:hypothetical protein